MIELQNIKKNFGELAVLKGVNLTLETGKVTAIIGASGAGKSTLLQIIGALDKPDSGSVIIDGKDLFKLKPSQLAPFVNECIGFVFQFHHLLPEFTALENVLIPARIGKRNMRDAEKKAKDLLEILGLDERMHHKPNQMSGGEQQRVAVARALINDPAVVLADEPTGNLDSENAKELNQLFKKLAKEFRQTFVIVTHNSGLAEMADTVVEISDGKVLN